MHWCSAVDGSHVFVALLEYTLRRTAAPQQYGTAEQLNTMFEQCTQVAPQTDSMHVATANMAQESNFWLSSPLITSGTATSSCSGSFRTAGAVDVVLGSHNELHLLTVAAEGRLETVFKQPLFCRVKQLCVLPFSLLQPSNMQTQASFKEQHSPQL